MNHYFLKLRFLYLGYIASLVFIGCAQSKGPEAGAKKQPATSTTGGGGTTSTGSATTGNDSTGGTSDSTTGGSSGPADVCSFMKSQPYASHAQKAISYFCDQGGIGKLKSSPAGQLLDLGDSQDGAYSTFTFSGMIVGPGSIDNLLKNAKLFCTNFNAYKALNDPAAYADVQSIVPSNVSSGGCDFDFTGTTQVIFTPKFSGHVEASADASKSVAFNASYLVKEISLVKASDTVSVAVKEGANIRLYMWATSTSDTKGFASMAKPRIKTGVAAGLKSALTLMSK